jgi:hypothetical protein
MIAMPHQEAIECTRAKPFEIETVQQTLARPGVSSLE